MLAVHDEASGRDRDQVLEVGLDPIPGLDGVEDNSGGDVGTGGVGDKLAHQ